MYLVYEKEFMPEADIYCICRTYIIFPKLVENINSQV